MASENKSCSNDGSFGEQTALRAIPLNIYVHDFCSVSALVIGAPGSEWILLPKRAAAFWEGHKKSSIKRVSRLSVFATSRKQKSNMQDNGYTESNEAMVSKTEDKEPPIETRSKRSRQQGDSGEGDKNRTNTQSSLRPTLGESRETCLHYATASGDSGALGGGELSPMDGIRRLSITLLAALAGCYARKPRESIRHKRLQGSGQLPDAR